MRPDPPAEKPPPEPSLALVVSDDDGRYVSVSAAAEALFGVPRDGLIGRSVRDFGAPGFDVDAAWRKFREDGQAQGEFRLRRGDGSFRIVEFAALAAVLPGRHVSALYDVTARKLEEEERASQLAEAQQARAAAQAASRAKDEFLATLSHELRTPLTAIVGWAYLLRSGTLDAPTAARAVETIDRNAQLQTHLISDILDVSRIVTGKLRLNVRPVELVPVLESAVDTVRPAADAKGIRLQAVLDPAAGPVSGDPERLQQIAWNLMSNAIKFTPRGGRVTLRLERVHSHVEIACEDTGAGIAADLLPFVFERFRQGEGASRIQGGLGLGLAIVRHIVELHGGSVEAHSRGPGQGATFKVLLPLMILSTRGDAVRPGRHPTAEDAPVAAARAPLEGVRVLVVEDQDDSRELMRTVLARRGARVTAVASAAEALRLIEAEPPDVLLSDIEMPDEDGYSLIRRVRALPPERGGRVPAAALTAFARTEDRMQALLAGFQIHLPKPVHPEELVTVVASLAGRNRT